MARRPISLAALALVAGLCAGCSSSSDDASPPRRSGTPTSSATTGTAGPTDSAAPATPDPSATLRPTERAALTSYFTPGPQLTGYTSLGRPAIDGDTVVVTAGKGDTPQDTVVSMAADTGKTRVVARTGYPHGFIGGSQVTGDWVVWVDQSAEQGEGVDSVRWRVMARNLSSGDQQVLADSPGASRYVPTVFATDGYVYWTTAESDRTARQWVWHAGSGKPKTVLRHQELTPELESVDAGRLYFLGPSSAPGHGHTVGGDCWSVPLTGGSPQASTRTSLALDCQAGSGWLVWSLHSDPQHPPVGQPFDDPYEIWARQVGSGQPVLLHRGYVGGGSPAIGDGYVVWDGNGYMAYAALDGKTGDKAAGPAVSLSGTTGAYGFAASGRRLAYVTFGLTGGKRQARLIVVEHR